MLPLLFYSHDRIMSKQARHEFVEPDLLSLLPTDASITRTSYEPDPGYPPIPPDPVVIIAQTSKTIERNPDDGEAYFQRGQNYFHLQKFDLALADYVKTIELNPEHSGAHYGLGAIYALQNKTDAAIEYLQKALALGFPYIHRIGRDPSWDNVRGNPAFQSLIAK